MVLDCCLFRLHGRLIMTSLPSTIDSLIRAVLCSSVWHTIRTLSPLQSICSGCCPIMAFIATLKERIFFNSSDFARLYPHPFIYTVQPVRLLSGFCTFVLWSGILFCSLFLFRLFLISMKSSSLSWYVSIPLASVSHSV